MSRLTKPDEKTMALLKRAGSPIKAEAMLAQAELAKALELPLRKGVLTGDILGGIYERIEMAPGTSTEFPLDLIAPGEEADLVAFTNPGHGRIPEHALESDYVMIPTYGITAAVDLLLRYVREARWDVVSRAAQALEHGFVKKINDDGWHTILAAGVDRNILVYDSDAAAGQFTKRQLSLMKTVMRRNAGGNTGSLNRGKLTDCYMSPEGVEDIRNWGVDQVDEVTRREMFVAADDGPALTRIFGVTLHAIDELGEGQEYQNYHSDQLGASLGPNSDVELIVGLDQSANDSFVMPIKMPVTIFEDDNMHRQQRMGWYGWAELGFGILDTRRLILGSF